MIDKIKNIYNHLVNNKKSLFWAIFLCAFAVRFIYILTLEDKWYFYDTVHYDKAANSIVAGEGFGTGYHFSSIEEFSGAYSLPPVYPIFLAGIYAVAGQNFYAVRIVQAILGALLCLVIYLISTKVFNKTVGLLAAAASIFYPLLIFTSGLLYSTIIFALFIALFVWFMLLSLEKDNAIWPILAGVSLGTATLAGPILFALYPMTALWILIAVQKSFLNKIRLGTLVFVAAILTLVPWGIRNYQIFGKITPVSASADWFLSEAQSRVQNNVKVKMSTDETGNQFHVFVSDEFDGTLTDTSHFQTNGKTLYSGLELQGGLSKYIEKFEIGSSSGEKIIEEFDQGELSNQWLADSSFGIVEGQLAVFSPDISKAHWAFYKSGFNPKEVAFEWGKDTEAAGVSQTALALMFDAPSGGNGYLVKRLPHGLLELWKVENGEPIEIIDEKMGEKSIGIGDGSQKKVSGGIFGKILYILTDNPIGFIEHYTHEFIHFWQLFPDRVMSQNQFTNWKTTAISLFTFGPILVFFVVGIFFSVKDWRNAALLVITVMSFALGYSFFQTRIRYRIPIEPFMIILASYGFYSILIKLNIIKIESES